MKTELLPISLKFIYLPMKKSVHQNLGHNKKLRSFRWFTKSTYLQLNQESIPVGCVRPACWSGDGAVRRGKVLWCQFLLWTAPPHLHSTSPPPHGQADRCKNICWELCLDMGHPKPYPSTYFKIFEIYPFVIIPGLFEYFSEKRVLSEDQSFLDEGGTINPF